MFPCQRIDRAFSTPDTPSESARPESITSIATVPASESSPGSSGVPPGRVSTRFRYRRSPPRESTLAVMCSESVTPRVSPRPPPALIEMAALSSLSVSTRRWPSATVTAARIAYKREPSMSPRPASALTAPRRLPSESPSTSATNDPNSDVVGTSFPLSARRSSASKVPRPLKP